MAINQSDLHLDQALTNISIKYKNAKYVGTEILPELPVKKESDVYFIYGREAFKRYNTKSNHLSRANEIDRKIIKSEPYSLVEHKVADFVSQREIDNADEPLKPEIDTTETLTDIILLDREFEIAELLTNPSNYPSGHAESLSGGNKWSDYTNSNPVKKVDEMRSKIAKELGGQYPNVMIVSDSVHNVLKMHPVIRDIIKYTAFGKATEVELAKIFEVDKYIVATTTYDTQKENVSETRQTNYVWGDNVILAYVNPKIGIKSVTFGLTFVKQNGRKVLVEELKDPEGKRIIVKDMFDVKLVCPYAGYLLTSVI